jgi:mannose-6-phosphate isomerase-like protein (cupin superfamily)
MILDEVSEIHKAIILGPPAAGAQAHQAGVCHGGMAKLRIQHQIYVPETATRIDMKRNQVIKNNATGERLTMLVSEEENGGARQLYEVYLPARRPSPPLHYHLDCTETFTVKQGKLDIYTDRDEKHALLHPGQSVTAQIGQAHRFANEHDEAVIFTVETKPAGAVVKAFQLAYGIANEGGAAKDGLPKNPIARVVFVKTTQGYLPDFPRVLQRMVFGCATLLAKITGLERRWKIYFT